LFVESIDIKEFKGIARCKTPLSFSEFTVMIGRNDSGKSSILEALSLIPLYNYALPYSGQNRYEIVQRLHGGKSSMVYGYSGEALLTYKIHGRTWTLKIKDNGEVHLDIEGTDKDAMEKNMVFAIGKALDIPAVDSDSWSKIQSQVFFIPSDTSFLNDMSVRLGQEENRFMVTKMGSHARVTKELINKCVDDNYTEILFAPELSARKEGEDKSPLYVKLKDLGDGVEKVVLVALWLEAINPSLVLWDDFEGSAHPSLIRVLLEWLSKKHWQVIMSTHSIDVLTSLLEVRPKNAKVIQLKKTNDILIQKDLTLEELEDIIDTSQDPRALVDSLTL
jgi:AAA15 family ATPase/GTPase